MERSQRKRKTKNRKPLYPREKPLLTTYQISLVASKKTNSLKVRKRLTLLRINQSNSCSLKSMQLSSAPSETKRSCVRDAKTPGPLSSTTLDRLESRRSTKMATYLRSSLKTYLIRCARTQSKRVLASLWRRVSSKTSSLATLRS